MVNMTTCEKCGTNLLLTSIPLSNKNYHIGSLIGYHCNNCGNLYLTEETVNELPQPIIKFTPAKIIGR